MVPNDIVGQSHTGIGCSVPGPGLAAHGAGVFAAILRLPRPHTIPGIPVAEFTLNVLAAIRVRLVDVGQDLADFLAVGGFDHGQMPVISEGRKPTMVLRGV
jgi:hypothetical protein